LVGVHLYIRKFTASISTNVRIPHPLGEELKNLTHQANKLLHLI